MLCKCLFLTALAQCSTDGIRSFAGYECKFVKACDVHKTTRPALNISYHLPQRLQLYSYSNSASSNRNLAHLCEGQRVAILFHCNSHIPLYAGTVTAGSQLNTAENGGRLQGPEGMFNPKCSKALNIFSNGTPIAQRIKTERFVSKTLPAKNLIDLTSFRR